MLAWQIVPATAMGNTFVLKPAKYTRLSGLMFAEIVAEAGLPSGVVNVITGSSNAGLMIVTQPDVNKIAISGSTEVRRILRCQMLAGTPVPIFGFRPPSVLRTHYALSLDKDLKLMIYSIGHVGICWNRLEYSRGEFY